MRVSESLVTWVVWRLRGGEGGSVGVVNGRRYEEEFFMRGEGVEGFLGGGKKIQWNLKKFLKIKTRLK